MIDFLSGATAMGFLISGVFFFRFWQRTGDVLFVAFGVAFLLLSLNHLLLVIWTPREEQSWAYLLRLLAFGLIIVAVIGKNFAGARPRQ
jgi:uncharacterized membrane protein